MVIFKSKQKKFEGDLKIKLCGKRLYPTSPLFKQNSILKFQNKICLENILFISKS